jgi:hypothetical protein
LRALTAGGYFYAFVREDGTVVRQSLNVDEEARLDTSEIRTPSRRPDVHRYEIERWEDLRILIRAINGPAQKPLVMRWAEHGA